MRSLPLVVLGISCALMSLTIAVVRTMTSWFSLSGFLANAATTVATVYLANFVYCLALGKEASFFSVRIPADDPDGQRESVKWLAAIAMLGLLLFQYVKFQ